MELIERYRGSLLGLAIGDALGAPLEFMEPGSFDLVNDFVGGGVFKLRPGDWSDDTSMALCLAESLIESRGVKEADQMERYLKWYHQGHLSSQGWCFDVCTVTRRALLAFESTRSSSVNTPADNDSTSSCLSRVSPLALAYSGKPESALELVSGCITLTHNSSICVDAARYLCALIIGSLQECSKTELLTANYCPVKDYWRHRPLSTEIQSVAAGNYKSKTMEDMRPTGSVEECLETALWAFSSFDTFEEGVLAVVNIGGDADSTGAVFGQLAGAYYGEAAIPDKWKTRVAMSETIRRYAEQLFALSHLIG